MDNKLRFFRLKNNTPLIAAAVLLLLTIAGCSGKSGNAATPSPTNDVDFRNITLEPGHSMLGASMVYFDDITGEITMEPLRNAEIHLNLTSLLNNANCPGSQCLTWKVTGYDAAHYTWFIDMFLTNPTAISAYDVRLIFTKLPSNPETGSSWKIMNPDSFTNIWVGDPEWDASADDWKVEDVGLKPFIAFEKDDPDRLFNADPDGNGPQVYTDKEQLLLKRPQDVPGMNFVVILDVSWPTHCKEPYQVVKMWQDGALPPNNLNGTTKFSAVVADWQQLTPGEGIEDVSVWVPDIADEADDYWVQMDEDPNWPPNMGNPPSDEWQEFITEFGGYNADTLRLFTCDIGNMQDVGVGKYPAVVRALSVDTDGQGYDTMYNIHEIDVATGGPGGDPDKNLMIAFSSYESGTSADIWAYSLKTGDVVQLTHDNGQNSEELDVAVSIKGEEIVFASNYNFAGSTPKADFDLYRVQISNFPPNQPWGPGNWIQFQADPQADERLPDFNFNGTVVAYCSNKLGQYEIYRKNIGTGQIPIRITQNYGSDEAPCWDKTDPTDHWLYFHSNRAGGSNYEIYGIDPTQVESSSNLPYRYTVNAGFDGYPTSRIGTADQGFAWASDRTGDLDIYYYDDTLEWPVNLTRIVDQEPGDPQPSDMWPSISKDNVWVTFASDRTNGDNDIWRVAIADKTLNRMTNDTADEIDPCYGGG